MESNGKPNLILDGTKLEWHPERVAAWERGERIAPLTIDMALTRACNYACHFCYAMLQENDREVINREVIYDFLEDAAEAEVKAISLVSDGESTISPVFVDAIVRGSELGISMATGTNGLVLTRRKLEEILPHLTYLRINFSAGEPERYAEIMGAKVEWFHRVCDNIREMVDIKKKNNLEVTIGLREKVRQPSLNVGQVCARSFEYDVRIESTDTGVPGTPPILSKRRIRRDGEPKIHFAVGKQEGGGHDPDDRKRSGREADFPVEDAWIGTEAGSPISVTDENRRGPAESMFDFGEVASHRGGYPPDLEETRRNVSAPDPLGVLAGDFGHILGVVAGYGLER